MCNEVHLLSFPLCHLKGIQYIRYWPSRRSAWLDIANLFDADEAEVNKNAKKRTRPIFSHLDRTSLSQLRIYYLTKKRSFLAGTIREISSGQDGHINQNTGIFILKGCLHDTGATLAPARVHSGSLSWLYICLHDNPAWVHPGCCTGARTSLRHEISQRYHVNRKRPHVSVWNRSASRLQRVAHVLCWISRLFHQHEVYLQITRYEMTQSSCKQHVIAIRNKKAILVWNSRRCEFSHKNTPLPDIQSFSANELDQ